MTKFRAYIAIDYMSMASINQECMLELHEGYTRRSGSGRKAGELRWLDTPLAHPAP